MPNVYFSLVSEGKKRERNPQSRRKKKRKKKRKSARYAVGVEKRKGKKAGH